MSRQHSFDINVLTVEADVEQEKDPIQLAVLDVLQAVDDFTRSYSPDMASEFVNCVEVDMQRWFVLLVFTEDPFPT